MSRLREIRTILRDSGAGLSMLAGGAVQTLRDEWLWQRIPPKPTTLQFPINDICNARCSMCGIWQRKRDHELTPEELRHILVDPLFAGIRYVGINGGEPTLRSDLPELGRVLVGALPRLAGVGIITNAVKVDQVISRVMALNDVVRHGGVSFEVTVSLDGVGDDHDRNRGVPGNFASAVRVIDALRESQVPLTIGCTLTPINCHGADDLLAWCERCGLDRFEFRLGVPIRRIYNSDFDVRHPFSDEQRFHLAMFFARLAHHPRIDGLRRQFYAQLSEQIARGAVRRAGCDWRTRGITLDTRGNLSYCSVASPILGSALERGATSLFKEGLPARREILSRDCDDCRHDLLGEPPGRERMRAGRMLLAAPWSWRMRRWRGWFEGHIDAGPRDRAPREALRPMPAQWRRVLITGWYGTETAGDKAILGELVHFLRTHAPQCGITLTTINRTVSEQTAREMDALGGIELVDLDDAHDPALIGSVDAVIVGGGPLEEINETRQVWRIFVEADRQRKARILFGCGVGPLHSERIRRQVAAICRLTTAGFLRDHDSRVLARQLGASAPLAVACDPALAYLRRWVAANPLHPQAREAVGELRVAGLLRANSAEYTPELRAGELVASNHDAAVKLAALLDRIGCEHDARIDLLAMHAVWIGGDDRLFNRRIADALPPAGRLYVERAYLPLDDLLSRIQRCDAGVAMRYHGHLFCMALGVPFVSIDYTGQTGKVHSLLQRIDYQRQAMAWRDLEVERGAGIFSELIATRGHWSAYLQAQADRLVTGLHDVYARLWRVRESLSETDVEKRLEPAGV